MNVAWWHKHPFQAALLIPFVLFFALCVGLFLVGWWLLGTLSTGRLWVVSLVELALIAGIVLFSRSGKLSVAEVVQEYSVTTSTADVVVSQVCQLLILNVLYYVKALRPAVGSTALVIATLNSLFVLVKTLIFCWHGMCKKEDFFPPEASIFLLVFSLFMGFQHWATVTNVWRPVSVQSLEATERRLMTSFLNPTTGVHVTTHMVAGHRTFLVDNQYVQSSSLPVLVLCHGYGGGAALWYQTFPRLSHHFRVIALDWKGCGGSQRTPFVADSAHAATSFFVDALDDWRSEMGRRGFLNPSTPITLCGHSMGAYLAANYVLRHAATANVEHLILVSPVGVGKRPAARNDSAWQDSFLWRVFTWLWEFNFTPQALIRFMGPLGPRIASTLLFHHFGGMRLRLPVAMQDVSDYMYQISALDGSGEFALSSILLPGAWARVPFGPLFVRAVRSDEVRCGVTCVFGGAHDWTPLVHGQDLVSQLNDVTFNALRPYVGDDARRLVLSRRNLCVRVTDGGHNLFMENPDEFTAKVVAASVRLKALKVEAAAAKKAAGVA